MEALRNAANAAANLVGYDTTTQSEQDRETSHISGGEAPQNANTLNSQSGIEPVNGQLGRGEAGAPYDAGNDQGLTDSYAQDTTSSRQTGMTSGLGSNTHNTSSSEPLKEKVASSLGVSGDDHSRGMGSRSGGPGAGSSSRNDTSRLGSSIGQGTSSEKHLYNSENAPGLGGNRVGDDFSDANTRHEGASKLPAALGSDAAAGHSTKGGIGSASSSGHPRSSETASRTLDSSDDSGLLIVGSSKGPTSGSGRSTEPTSGSGLLSSSGLGTGAADGIAQTLRYGDKTGENTRSTNTITSGTSSGAGETLARKAEEHLPGSTKSTSSTGYNDRTSQNTSGLISPTHNNAYSATGTSGPTSSGTGLDGSGTGLTGTGSSLTGSNVGGSVPRYGGQASGYADDIDDGCEASHGYKPHGGHPIGEEAHKQGESTYLNYQNDSALPLGRAKPE